MRRSLGIVVTVCITGFLVMTGGCRSGQKEESRKEPKQEPKKSAPRMVKNPLKSPEETVKAYLDLDGQGRRLTSKTWAAVLPYISWQEEAGWDSVTVISGYEILKPEKRKDAGTAVTVRFDVVGSLAGEYQPSRRSETVVFTVKMTEAGWKIVEPDTFRPHVLVNPLVTHLEETREHELAQRVQTGGRP